MIQVTRSIIRGSLQLGRCQFDTTILSLLFVIGLDLSLRGFSVQQVPYEILVFVYTYCSVKVLYPATEAGRESEVVSGNGDIAPGVAAQVFIDFVPDALGEYHDTLHVVTEAGTFEVSFIDYCLFRTPSLTHISMA